MTLLALFSLTGLLLLLPLLPALREWRRPTDLAPLHIDSTDALDPPCLARAFRARLDEALGDRAYWLGHTRLARAPDPAGPDTTAVASAAWPLSGAERRRRSSHRIWHGAGAVTLPGEVSFLAEVAAASHLHTAANQAYRGLWAGGQLVLARCSIVLRWAHAQVVEVQGGCQLAGRVTAAQHILLLGPATFGLLHAPAVCFAADPALASGALDRPLPPLAPSLPAPVQWDHAAGRGRCDGPLALPPDTAWRGDLVAGADLLLGSRCTADGSLKAHGQLQAGPGCRVQGALVARGDIHLGPNCTVGGAVVSESEIVLGAGCVVGAPDRPATVAAPRIRVAAGVVVHGTVWAGQIGRASGELQPASPGPHDGGGADRGFHDWAETRVEPRPAARRRARRAWLSLRRGRAAE